MQSRVNELSSKGLLKGKLVSSDFSALVKVCLPLMISQLTACSMIFCDRVILARFSPHALISVTTASNVFYIFLFAVVSIVSISQIFVGRLNGAGRYTQVAEPIWQMIWFSFSTSTILATIGFFCGEWFLPHDQLVHGLAYFQWMMCFSWVFAVATALSSFFIGIGKLQIIWKTLLVGNLVNIVLSCSLVFGVNGIIPAMGAKGAAIGTIIAECVVALLLFAQFTKKSYREKYHTLKCSFQPKLLLSCIKIGAPNAFGHMSSTMAWAYGLILMSNISETHVLIMSIGLSLWVLFSYLTESLQRGVSFIASNLIGANREDEIARIFKSGLKLQLVLSLILAIPLLIYPDIIINLFLSQEAAIEFQSADIVVLLRASFIWLWGAYLFDGISWVIEGILTAGGDTRFMMLANLLGSWIGYLLPIYVLVYKLDGGPAMSMQLAALYSLALTGIYFWRYRSNRWSKRLTP